MQFKIDTKENYSHITPLTDKIDANLTGALAQKCSELAQTGKGNVLIDLNNCKEADSTSFNDLLKLHEDVYSNAASIVFTGLQDDITKAFKQKGIDTQLNIAPTIAEAIDIISMEMLERDLFDEES